METCQSRGDSWVRREHKALYPGEKQGSLPWSMASSALRAPSLGMERRNLQHTREQTSSLSSKRAV